MRRLVIGLVALLMVSLCGVPISAKVEGRDLNTLEGSYKFTVTLKNPDSVLRNMKAADLYGDNDALPDEILKNEFILDIKQKDGNFLLFDRGHEIKNNGLHASREYFNFRFDYKINSSSASGFMYEFFGTKLFFNNETKEFDTFEFSKSEGDTFRLFYYVNEQKEPVGNGSYIIEKLSREPEPEKSKKEDKKTENLPTVKPEDQIPRGITFVRGIVEVKRAGTDKWIKASKNMGLNPGDMVRTGKGSHAELGCQVSEFALAAGSDIRMGPLSVITVPDDTLKVEKKSMVRVAVDDAIKNVYALFGKEEFEVETPSAVMGIRGTDFIVDVDEDGNTTVLLNEGSVVVTSKYDNMTAGLKPGQKITALISDNLAEPEEMSRADIAAFEDVVEEEESSNSFLYIIILALLFLFFMGRKKKKKKLAAGK